MSRDESTFLFPDTDTDNEPHTASSTAYLLDELALHGHRPGQDEPDPRPLPEPDAVRGQLDAIVEILAAMLTGTRLEDDLADLLWSFVNLFHRKVDRIERELDLNEQAQRRGQAEQGRFRSKVGRARTSHRPGPRPHRAAQRLRICARPHRRIVRRHNRQHLAAALRIHGQSPRAHRLAHRQPGISRRPPPRGH